MYLESNLKKVEKRIKEACIKYGRNSQDINLVVVSKTFPVEDVINLYKLGIKDFGENYIQEWDKKRKLLPNDIIWHIIGNIQSNKTAIVANHANWVHTIDKLKIAQRLNNQRDEELAALNVCIEVNISREENKHGIVDELDVFKLAEKIQELPKLKLRGLMCIPSNSDEVIVIQEMQKMHSLFLKIQEKFKIDTLSMGMSSDLELAIASEVLVLE